MASTSGPQTFHIQWLGRFPGYDFESVFSADEETTPALDLILQTSSSRRNARFRSSKLTMKLHEFSQANGESLNRLRSNYRNLKTNKKRRAMNASSAFLYL
jgi:hypothetical protein